MPTLINLRKLDLYNFIERNSLTIGRSLVFMLTTFASFSSLRVTPRQSLAIANSILVESLFLKNRLFMICRAARHPQISAEHADR